MGAKGEHWGGGCRKILNFRVLLMHWTGGWLSGEEEHFESSEKSSCASEPLRAPTTDYQVHRGGENLSLDWNRHLNAYAVMHPLRLIFLGKKCLEKMFIPSPVGTKKAVPLC